MENAAFNSYKQVYVVEDDPLVAETLALIISREGYRTRHFSSAEECLSEVTHRRPDLIVTDVSLEKMSGLQMAFQLRESCPDLPCLLMSAREPRRVGESHGAPSREALEVFRKPIHPKFLLTEIHRRIGKPGCTLSEDEASRKNAG